MYDYVRPEKVMAALHWLKPLYRGITIHKDWVNKAVKDDHALWCTLTAQPQAEDEGSSVNSK